jgi:hypothetical protein
MATETPNSTIQSFAVQVTIDSADPHELARWWADTLRWEVEAQDEGFIRSMIEQGHATEADTRTYRGALVWCEGAAIGPRGDAGPGQPRILFQLVPEAKTVKNRLHLDVRPTTDDVGALRDELVRRGATIVGGGRQGPHEWVTFADPEGNEFCL